MGRVSGIELAVIAVVFGALLLPIWMLGRTTWIERVVSRLVAKRFAHDHSIEATPTAPFVQSKVGILSSIFVVLAFAWLASTGKLAVRVSYSGETTVPASLALSLLSALLVLAAVVIHWAGPGVRRRRLKYELFFGSWSSIVAGVALDVVAGEIAARGSPYQVSLGGSVSVPIPWQATLWMLLGPALLLAISLSIRALAGRVARRADAHGIAVRWNRRLSPFGFWLIIMSQIPFVNVFAAPLLLFYFPLRYEIKALLMQRPIVYLRSFHSDAARVAFSRIVVPVAGRYGVLAGLVSDSQPAHQLEREVSQLQRGQFFEVAAEIWKKWVTKALGSCHSVVIDLSQASNNVAWELTEALRILGPSRVMILARNDAATTLPTDELRIVPYALDKRGKLDRRARKEARRELTRSFAALLETDLAPGHAGAEVAPRALSPHAIALSERS